VVALGWAALRCRLPGATVYISPAGDCGITVTSDKAKPNVRIVDTAVAHDDVEAAIQRLESSGASPHVRAAVEGLRALGYELKPAGTIVPGKVPENYLRIIGPRGTGSVGQLWPTYFGFSRASDRERLLALDGAEPLTAAVKFSHVEGVQPGLNAAKLLKS